MKNIILNIFLCIVPNNKFYKLKSFILNTAGLKVGKNTRITGNIKIYGKGNVIIGDNVWLGIGCKFYLSDNAEIRIGNNCDIAPQVIFHTGTHKTGGSERRAGLGVSNSITIENGVWIGLGSIILAGSFVESGVIIGAGSVLISDSYKSNSLYAGNPAIQKKMLEV